MGSVMFNYRLILVRFKKLLFHIYAAALPKMSLSLRRISVAPRASPAHRSKNENNNPARGLSSAAPALGTIVKQAAETRRPAANAPHPFKFYTTPPPATARPCANRRRGFQNIIPYFPA
ncbi:MAG: hypothetical protein DBY36_00380 [Clostridiales bacterium]|nr:MAG: hypothetical protein DBY36_00380 [Clostridiales bacterium]